MSRARRGGTFEAARARAAAPRGWGEVRRAVLPNGLVVVTAPAPHLHSAMIALYVRAGSRHESAATNGISHFLEHLFFRGSEGYPDSAAMNAVVEAAGGNLNGMTARDHGCYFTPIHGNEVATGLAVLGDLVRRPLLKEMDIEREIILEEILDELDARGRDIDPDNLVKQMVFGSHPLGFKIAGTPATLRALDEEAVRLHHARFYGASNMVLSVAGPVRPAEVADIALQHLGVLPRGRPASEAPPPPWPRGPLLKVVGHQDAQVEFTLAFPSPPEHHPDFPVLLCLRRLLDDGLSSRLPFEIVERRGLAYSIHAGMDVYADAGVFFVDGACAPPKAARAVEEILRVLGALAARPVPEEELLRVQRRHRMSLAFSLDSPGDLAGWYGSGELLRAPEAFEARCRRVEAVTPADVRRVARTTLARRNLAAVAVGPLAGKARRELSRAARKGGDLPG